MARGAGVNPEDPPLRWEVSQGHGAWTEVDVLEDATGGFNYGSGTVEVQCPPSAGIEPIAGRRLHWLRCRIAETTRLADRPAAYQHAPEIYRDHRRTDRRAARRRAFSGRGRERSSGRAMACRVRRLIFASPRCSRRPPARRSRCRGRPATGSRGRRSYSFADSSADDRHFTTERVGGRIRFGPELRDPAGGDPATWRDPAQGRRAAHVALSPRRRHGRQRRGRQPGHAAQRDPRRRVGDQSGAGPRRDRSTERRLGARACRASDSHPVSRRHGGGL